MDAQLTALVALERDRARAAVPDAVNAGRSAPRRGRRRRLALLAAAGAALAVPPAAQATTAVTEAGGQVVVHGDDTPNNVHVRVAGGTLRVVDPSGVFDPDRLDACAPLTSTEMTCDLGRVKAIIGFTSGSDDVWRSDTSLPTLVDGGQGSDVVARGFFDGSSRLEVRGGDGFDRVEYVASTSGVVVSKDDVANDGRPGIDADNIHGDVEWLMGSFHNDTLSGSNSAPVEFIEGMAGDDLLLGHGGRDVFRTAAVADGADQIFGGADEDTVDYARRTRPVTASLSDGGADDGEAGEGDEIRQVETARGGSAGDTLRVHPDGTTPATLIGLGGNDTLIGARGGDTVNGGPGRDTVQTFGGNDVIQARDNEADTVACGTESDTVDAEIGLDLMSGCERVERIGRLSLRPAVARATADAAVRLDLAWRHPQSWRKLRRVTLRLSDAGVAVGQVTIDLRRDRMAADGAVRLARRATRLSHTGATATARLGLRVDPSLRGRTLRLDVEAVDVRGRRQLETRAGILRIAR